jgi:hypothetical protein
MSGSPFEAAPRRRWLRRNLLIIVPVLIAIVAASGAFLDNGIQERRLRAKFHDELEHGWNLRATSRYQPRTITTPYHYYLARLQRLLHLDASSWILYPTYRLYYDQGGRSFGMPIQYDGREWVFAGPAQN